MSTPGKLVVVLAALAAALVPAAWARDTMAITIPLRSKLSPVQRMNREGVEAVNKHEYEKAEAIFLKAYLYDPSDPFTLNNLGYIAELQGQLDRAHKFYQLAAEQGCNAAIDASSAKELKGKPMRAALENIQDGSMRVNRMNVEAMRLLSQGRGFQAVTLLRQALAMDAANPFTLNNLGVADEAIGDNAGALKFYRSAAEQHSSEPVIVTVDRASRGKGVSEVAAASAKRLEKRMQDTNPDYARALMFSLQGVFAANQNDWGTARQDFLRAYSLDSSDAFTLNNRGYVAERDGDLETAKFFYEKARRAGDAGARVGMATDGSAEGKPLFAVASDSNHKVDGVLDRYSWQRHGQSGPIELTPRGGASNETTPAAPSSQPAPSTATPQPPQSIR
jgi:Flp pilus assembly protein TadD